MKKPKQKIYKIETNNGYINVKLGDVELVEYTPPNGRLPNYYIHCIHHEPTEELTEKLIAFYMNAKDIPKAEDFKLREGIKDSPELRELIEDLITPYSKRKLLEKDHFV